VAGAGASQPCLRQRTRSARSASSCGAAPCGSRRLDYPWGMPEDRFEERLRLRTELWGDEETTRMIFTTIGDRLAQDPSFPRWLVKIQRYGAAPGDLVTFSRVWFSTDARSALPAIQVPTLVLVRKGWPPGAIEESEWTANQIPGAHLRRLHGDEDDPTWAMCPRWPREVGRFISSIHEEQAVAQAIIRSVASISIKVRAGIHAGEVETIEGKAGGIAVAIGPRIGALAGPSEILASSTVKKLTSGSGLTFEDVGDHALKGVPDRWHLYRVAAS
jgi:class 3 adenylate cyclase